MSIGDRKTFSGGRLVLHRTRIKARSGGGIDRSVPTEAAVQGRILTKQRTAARRAARAERLAS